MKPASLYIVMMGLPARGKSTVASKLRESLRSDGIAARIFNNGDLRRRLSKENTSYPEFFNPRNRQGASLRERYAVMNLTRARNYIEKGPSGRKVAIIDASNVSGKRRRMILNTLGEEHVLFIECLHGDQEIIDANIRNKVESPEFAHLSRIEAISSFRKRISYYEGIYRPLKRARNFFTFDTFNYRILREKISNGLPFADRIRDFLVTPYIKNLYIVRHTETFYNVEDRIGGDSDLTPRGRSQARALARHFSRKEIPLIFTSSMVRTLRTAEHVLRGQKNSRVIPLNEFDEIESGICDRMTYAEIRALHPKITAARKRNKYFYRYPGGEGYASMEERIWRGIKKVIYLSKHSDNIMIIGHRAANRMLLSYFVYKRREDVPYIYMPQDGYYHISLSQNKKVFQLRRFL